MYIDFTYNDFFTTHPSILQAEIVETNFVGFRFSDKREMITLIYQELIITILLIKDDIKAK